MRLLHFDSSSRLALTNFSGKDIPPYAILSHRWSDNEVSFEDVVNSRYEGNTVHWKIDFCTAQAAQDQLEYFWIDTCCFDKWNRAERANAVESMFRWYESAVKCYVLLSDVSVPDPTDINSRTTWEMAFRNSDWFKRGWTLQELLAPRSVDFFSKEGYKLGDKQSLRELLHEITGISAEALQGCPLERFSIDERMEWAKNRDTTEPEDAAYCLFGIFDIHVPPSYGEGKEQALKRLKNELHLTAAAPSTIPFSPNHRFVGRDSQLGKLKSTLFQDPQTTFLAITGAGGTGKSQLALALAYAMRAREENCAVFWVDASDPNRIQEGYVRIAQKLGLPSWNDGKTDIKTLVHGSLSKGNAWRWLLVFDNVTTTTFDSSGLSSNPYADAVDLFPRHKQGSVVFTTNSKYTAEILAKRNVVTLQGLMPDAAQTMLKHYLNKAIPVSETEQARLLLNELAHLPLAIVHAGAYMKLTNMSIEEYRSHLAKHIQNCTLDPVTATLLVSLDAIRQIFSKAAEYLFLIACVDQTDIAEDLLAPPTPERKITISTLEDFSLITRRPPESAMDIHRLVRNAVRSWLRHRQFLEDWTSRATKRLLDVFPDAQQGNRSKWRRLLPHAKEVLQNLPNQDFRAEKHALLWRCAMATYSDGSWKEAETFFKEVIEIRKQVLGKEHPMILSCLANLASTYWEQGRWKEAEDLEMQVMETRKRGHGAEHHDTLTSMNNYAVTSASQGRWEEAELLFLQVVGTRKQMQGGDHPATLTSMANLAVTYWNQGRWKEAEELDVQVMETRKRVLGEEHPDTLISIGSLASTYWRQGRWKEAERLHVQVVQTMKRVLGEEHPNTLTSMNNLASTYQDQGRWKELEEVNIQVMKIRKRVLGEEHPDTLHSIANLASTYQNQERWKEAEQLEVPVMEARKRVLGEEHPDTLASIANLASIYWNQERWKEAVELDVQVMETRKRVLGEEHHDTLTSMANLAIAWRGFDLLRPATELLSECVSLSSRSLGAEHPDTVARNKLSCDWKNEDNARSSGAHNNCKRMEDGS